MIKSLDWSFILPLELAQTTYSEVFVQGFTIPSKSPAQAKLMAAAHNPKFAKSAGVQVAVAKEFNRADQLESPHRKKLVSRSKST